MVGGYDSGTLGVGLMGDNLEIVRDLLDLFLVFSLCYYYMIHIQA
jgi:hypothetical protein